MSSRLLPALLILVTMLAALGMASVLHPKKHLADPSARVELERIIPERFANWRKEDSGVLVINPQTQAQLDHIYAQTLSRTYISTEGDRVMLSIAYGEDQSDSTQVHRPDICYPSQGFQLLFVRHEQLLIQGRQIPVVRMNTKAAMRLEPVTYWIRTGDFVTPPGWRQKFAQLRHSLRGTIPDGLLVRVSTLSPDADASFARHDAFLRDLVQSQSLENQHFLIGREDH